MERNSDIVRMTSYAPLFANYGHTQWNPNLIGYDQVDSYGSTSYYVQSLFASNVGDTVVPVTASADRPVLLGDDRQQERQGPREDRRTRRPPRSARN